MRGASRDSLASALDRLEALLDAVPAAADRIRLAEDLFGVVGVLDTTPALRRALTDPSRDGDSKAQLAQRLFRDRVGRDGVDIVSGAVRGRWSQARDLADALDHLGTTAVLAAAEAGGRLEAVEDELFRFQRILLADRGLRQAFTERRAPATAKHQLVDRLLDDRSAPETAVLVRRIAGASRGLTPEQAFERILEAAAERRERLIAHVTAAVPLTERQRERLAGVLASRYGRRIRLAVDVEPAVVGGLRVHVGDEILDGSLSRRLATAAEVVTR
jgi:F-type H+-transporting ATPase subunit delta